MFISFTQTNGASLFARTTDAKHMANKISATNLVSTLKAAGELTRLRLLALLSLGEFNVKDLTRILGQSQPRVSRHLKLLADVGLVERYQEGSWVFFRLCGDGPNSSIRRLILAQLDENDPALKRDRARADMIRNEREEAAQAYFRANAAQWDRIRSLHAPEEIVTAAMKQAMGTEPFELLVDIGTGTGHVLEVFAPQAASAVGVDLNRDMLAYARAKIDRLGYTHVQLRQADLFNLPFAERSADAVIIHQVLHFLEEPGSAIREAARILKCGGRLLVVDFAPHHLEFLREQFAHRRLGFGRDQVAAWLKKQGLSLAMYRELKPETVQADETLTVALWLGLKPPAERAQPATEPARKAKQSTREVPVGAR